MVCNRVAEYVIQGDGGPEDYTLACAEHLAALLGPGTNTVFQLESDDDGLPATCCYLDPGDEV